MITETDEKGTSGWVASGMGSLMGEEQDTRFVAWQCGLESVAISHKVSLLSDVRRL